MIVVDPLENTCTLRHHTLSVPLALTQDKSTTSVFVGRGNHCICRHKSARNVYVLIIVGTNNGIPTVRASFARADSNS